MKKNNIYKLNAVITFSLIILLVLVDWISVADNEVNNIFSRIVRILIIVQTSLITINFYLKKPNLKFHFARPLKLLLFVYLISVLLSDEISSHLYTSSKLILWVISAFYFNILFAKNVISYKLFSRFIFSVAIIMALLNIFVRLNVDELTGINAYTYALVWTMPALYCLRKSTMWYVVFTLILLSILYSIKRGAIISLAVCIIFYYLNNFFLTKNPKIIIRLFFVGVFFGLISYFSYLKNQDSFEQRFSDLSGSGRTTLYVKIFNQWLESEDLSVYFFGNGVSSVQKFTKTFFRDSRGIHSHSDFLQFLFDFGILGIFLIIYLYKYMFSLIKKGNLVKSPYSSILSMSFGILLCVNIFSGQLIYANHMIYFSMILALTSNKISKAYSNVRDI